MQCNYVEDEEHFFLFYSIYTDLRITLFDKLHLKIPALKLNIIERFKVFYDLVNPRNNVNSNVFVNLFTRHRN